MLVITMPAYKELSGLKSFIPEISDAFIQEKIKIIVVDDASYDGTTEFLRENYPTVDVLENKLNHIKRAAGFFLQIQISLALIYPLSMRKALN